MTAITVDDGVAALPGTPRPSPRAPARGRWRAVAGGAAVGVLAGVGAGLLASTASVWLVSLLLLALATGLVASWSP